jgi:tetratricopeptide (TPR) repeat protein
MVHQINEIYSRGGVTHNQSGEEILNSAKMWVDSRDYQKAIDRYLEITDHHFTNPDHLESIWMDAFNIAMTYAKDRIQEVVPIVGARLMAIQRFESAGEVFESVGYYDKAVEAFTKGQKWERAVTCAGQVRPMELQNMLLDEIQRQKKV